VAKTIRKAAKKVKTPAKKRAKTVRRTIAKAAVKKRSAPRRVAATGVSRETKYAIRIESVNGAIGYFASVKKGLPIFDTESRYAITGARATMEAFAEMLAKMKPKGVASVEVISLNRYKRNPARRAAKLYEEFTGHPADREMVTDISDLGAVARIGKCRAIGYETVRDGKKELYMHEFSTRSAPVLSVSGDGLTAVLSNGRFQFTDSGFNDL